MALTRRRRGGGNGLDAWPGYVDALSTLLLVIIFVLLVFVLGQAFLSVALTGRERALEWLTGQIARLTTMLALEDTSNAKLRIAESTLTSELSVSRHDLASEKTLSASQASSVALLNAQLVQLRQQLAAIASALDVSKQQLSARDVQIADLDKKLNLALADKVEQLKRFRSEFFGELQQVLKGEKGVAIVGDRFVFQSEVLFPVGSAQLSPAGVAQIRKLAATLKTIEPKIPADISWVLRVDGHADRQRAKGVTEDTNWELSTQRAINVVRLLIREGIAPDHLAAAGFGEFQPLDTASTQAAFARNRRIELRLTDR